MNTNFFRHLRSNMQSGVSMVETMVAVGVLGVVVTTANAGLSKILQSKSRLTFNDAGRDYVDSFRGVAMKTVATVFEDDTCLTAGTLTNNLKTSSVIAKFRDGPQGSKLVLVDYEMTAGETFTDLATGISNWAAPISRCGGSGSRGYSCLTLQEQSMAGVKIRNIGFVEARYMLINIKNNTRDFRFGAEGSTAIGPTLEALPDSDDCFEAKTLLGTSAQISYVVYSAKKVDNEPVINQKGGVVNYLANSKVAENLTITVAVSGTQSPYSFCGWRCLIPPLEPMPIVEYNKQVLDTEPYRKDAAGTILTNTVTTNVTDPVTLEVTTVTTEEPIVNPTFNQLVTNTKYGHLRDGLNDAYLAFRSIYDQPSDIPYQVSDKRWTRKSFPCNGSGTYNDTTCPKWPIGGEGDWACPYGYSPYGCSGAAGVGCNLPTPGDCRRPDSAR